MTFAAAGAFTPTQLYDPLPPDLADSHQHLRARVRDFLARQQAAGGFTPRCDAWLSGWDPTFSRLLAEQGWVGMTIPTEYGGHGRSPLERYVVTIELLAAGAPVSAHWFADRQTAPSLLRYGNERLKRRYLPAIARGECFFAIGMSEPDSGSDLASIRTRGTPVPGGWRVTGRKVWTSGAHHAHAFAVLCRTGDGGGNRHAGLSQLIVPLDSAGVDVRPIALITGEEHFNEVVLDDVFVPDDMVLGTVGEGWQQVTSELAFERSGPERFLSTFPLLAALVDVMATREPVPCAELGALYADLLILRELSWSVARRLDRGETPNVEAALVKDLGTQFERTVAETARRLVPAQPQLDAGTDYERLMAEAVLHAPGFTLRGGTTEILRQIVAQALVAKA